MKSAERKVLAKVYDCVNRMSGMEPSNPAYLEAKARSNTLQTKCCRSLVLALSCLNCGDLEMAHEYADDAKKVLGISDD